MHYPFISLLTPKLPEPTLDRFQVTSLVVGGGGISQDSISHLPPAYWEGHVLVSLSEI